MLENLKTHLIGNWGVEIRNPSDAERDQAGQISRLLREIAGEASVVRVATPAGP
jgi:hypothetical protein